MKPSLHTKELVRPPAHDTWAPASVDDTREIEELLYVQAACLDGRQWDRFISLFTEDGLYWMPARAEQETHEGQPSIFAEDRDMMGLRALRLQDATAWSMAPRWATSHLVGNVIAFRAASRPDVLFASSRFHVTELRRDATRSFAGTYRHTLRRTGEGLRVQLQRVDLLTAEAPFDYVLQAWL